MEETLDKPMTGHLDGMVAFFDHPNDLLEAAAKARDQFKDWGVENWDTFSPFPIHGMDGAMGLKRSWIPFVTFGAALTGLTTALTIQIGTMFVDWQINIGGKPFLPWPAFVPVSFELTVLFAGLTTVAVMFLSTGHPNFRPKVIDPRITRDRFALWISAEDKNFEIARTRAFLESLHALEVREVTFES